MAGVVTALVCFVLLAIAALLFKLMMLPVNLLFAGVKKIFSVAWIRNLILLAAAAVLAAGAVFVWEWQRPSWYPLHLIPEEDMKLIKLRKESMEIEAEETWKDIQKHFKRERRAAESKLDDRLVSSLETAKDQAASLKLPNR